jgi:integrase
LYLAEGCATKKASTIATDKGRIARHIKPLLGKRKVKDLTPNDVHRFLQQVAQGKTAVDEKTGKRGRARVTGGKGAATRTVGLLGGILSFAVSEGIRPDNPARGVKRYPDTRKERFLSPEELARLGEALSTSAENPYAVAAIRFLLLTGCRKGEVLSLTWPEVDFAFCCLRLSDSKTGQKVVPLGRAALDVLDSLPRLEGNDHVFPGEKEGRPLVGLPKIWNRIKTRAGLDGVRLHDLRHSFASVGAGYGLSLHVVGKLLGHSDPKTTARYAHIADDPARTAANHISAAIEAGLSQPFETVH